MYKEECSEVSDQQCNTVLEQQCEVREAIGYQIGCFFTHCVKGVGGSNPCVKIYVVDLYHSGGLLTTKKLTQKSIFKGKIVTVLR